MYGAPQNFVLKLHVVQTKLCRVKPKLRAIENDQNRRECNCSCPCPKESHVPEISITILFVGSMLTGISRDRGFEPTVGQR